MSRSGILAALRNEEKELRLQLVAIQRAIDAIQEVESGASGSAEKARPAGKRTRRAMSTEQRRAVSERMRNYWAARREEQAQAAQSDAGA